jgi:nucleoside-diphosphate-sugar epimerase
LNGETINIGTGNSTTILELANMFGSEIKKLPPRRIDLQSTRADTNLAKEILGFEAKEKLSDWVDVVKRK